MGLLKSWSKKQHQVSPSVNSGENGKPSAQDAIPGQAGTVCSGRGGPRLTSRIFMNRIKRNLAGCPKHDFWVWCAAGKNRKPRRKPTSKLRGQSQRAEKKREPFFTARRQKGHTGVSRPCVASIASISIYETWRFLIGVVLFSRGPPRACVCVRSAPDAVVAFRPAAVPPPLAQLASGVSTLVEGVRNERVLQFPFGLLRPAACT